MKKKEFTSLKEKNISDLEKILSQKKKDLLKLKVKIVSGEEKNVRKAKNLRLEIAKTFTLIREKMTKEKDKEAKE